MTQQSAGTLAGVAAVVEDLLIKLNIPVFNIACVVSPLFHPEILGQLFVAVEAD